MANYQYMMSADDVARELNCSKSHAYKLVKSMNEAITNENMQISAIKSIENTSKNAIQIT